MNNLICMAHNYKGNEPPNLTCKVCCVIFIKVVKAREDKSSRKQSQ
jgi:hypothetical protein